jgi:SAM-dependent methyltransferase
MDITEINDNIHRHPWESSRADFILSVLKTNKDLVPNASVLDIGCGDLYFSYRLKERTPSLEIDAVDLAFDDDEIRHQGIQKIKHMEKVLHKKYDVIFAMDVLEHVENDEAMLNQLIALLKPNGILFITVPAFQFLYSYHDLLLKHLRRYHRGHLQYLINDMDAIKIRESFYFFHLLIYLRMTEKLLQFFFNLNPKKKHSNEINAWMHPERHPLTKSLGTILTMDARICRYLAGFGIRLPGLSLATVIQKKA